MVGGAEGVVLADLFSIQPEAAFPDHPFQKKCDPLSFPLFRNFDSAAVPSGADIGKLPGKAGETCLTDFRFGAARGSESGLIRCTWQRDGLIKTGLGVEPVLAEAESFGVESDLPSASKGLGFLRLSERLEKKEGEKQIQSQEAREVHEEVKS